MKGTNLQPRRFRRAARRVVMWAALVAAVGIGVVWAGGERTRFEWWTPVAWREPGPLPSFSLRGVVGGMEIRFAEGEYVGQDGVVVVRVLSMWHEHWFGRAWLWGPSIETSASSGPSIGIPYWLPMLLSLITFALLFRVERRDKRLARAGHCVCGYSLAGLADGAVCPECGKGRH